MEPISTQQKTVELLEERIERFKELQVDIVRLKNFKEFRGHLGNLGFTIGELEKRYQRLYQETVHLMQKYTSVTYQEFEGAVYRETSRLLNKTTFYDQFSIMVGNLLLPLLRRVDKILARTNACITTLEAYRQRYE
jgi:hypothetical protein